MQITEHQKYCLKTYVQTKPVFLFHHQDQIEVISSFPYIAASGDTMEEAVNNWLFCLEDWAEAFEKLKTPLNQSEKRQFTMPILLKFQYYFLFVLGLAFNAICKPKHGIKTWAWQNQLAH
jgi:hypothetical protein